MDKERVDQLLVKLGLAESREEAKRFVMAGTVYWGTERVDKPGARIPSDAALVCKGDKLPYVGRGALKLERALQVFPVDLQGRIVLDVGSSTGGFTDCALQAGAALVYSVDVGYGQLAWKLRQDPRVRVMERTNFRSVDASRFDPQPDAAVMDVSFISMEKLLPKLREVLVPGAPFIGLVKPQFEAGPEKVGKGGIVRDPEVHREVLRRVFDTLGGMGFFVCGVTPSPIRGGDGNIEYLMFAYCGGQRCDRVVDQNDLDEAVNVAHHQG